MNVTHVTDSRKEFGTWLWVCCTGDVWRQLGHPEESSGTECGHYQSQVWPHLRRKCRCVGQRIQRFSCFHPLLEEQPVHFKPGRISCICPCKPDK